MTRKHLFTPGLGLLCALPLAAAIGACGDDDAATTPPDTSYDSGTDAPPPGTVLPDASHGSAIALSPDDSIAVMVNRDVGSVSVFDLTYPGEGASATVTKKAEVSLGAGSEPWQVVIGPDGATAYVVLRKEQKLVRIDYLKTAPVAGKSVSVGSEPTGVALSPTGKSAFVTNWVDGTISVIDTASMAAAGAAVDLNAPLTLTGLLGAAPPRAAIAHPRSIAITNNKDASDDDESAYVTEYYAHRTAPETADGKNADVNKVGLVYKISLKDRAVSIIRLPGVADMGFKDQNGGDAACFPNQLQSIAIDGARAYVTSICASPKGPVGVSTGPTVLCPVGDADCPGAAVGSCNVANKVCKTNCTTDAQCGANGGKCGATTPNLCAPNVASLKTAVAPAITTIDLVKNEATTSVSLNASFNALYTKLAGPDDGTRRLPAAPADITFVAGGNVGYVAANAADSVFRVKYDNGNLVEVGASNNAFIDLAPAGIAPAAAGKNPIGLATTHTGKKFLFVANDVSRNLTAVDLNTQAVAGGPATPVVASAASTPAAGSPEDAVLRGKRFFNTGVGRWSLKGQAWNACQSCHVDGLSDNVTWYFARGPRQSTSLDGSYSKKDPYDQRIFNWSAINDEVTDFELNTRGISGGVGAIVSVASAPPTVADRIDIQSAATNHAGLNGSSAQAADKTNPAALPAASVLDDWKEITAYVKTIRSPRGATNLDPAKVAAGKTLFKVDGNCQGCHGGDKWTISTRFFTPSSATMSGLKAKAWAPPAGFPASLLPATTSRFMRFSGTDPAKFGDFDQMQCILRPVGTFGVAEGAAGVAELRANMSTPAQGNEADGKGFNPPSLLGLGVGAPFFHAGNATSLEAVFSTTFTPHHGALAPNFLSEADPQARAAKVDALVQYILSIDGSTPSVPIPAAGAQGGDFCAP
jgi:mono/diheme cytochrome c family protein